MTGKKIFLYWVMSVTLVLGLSSFLLYSCGGDGDSGGNGIVSSTVGVYLTDDASLYTQVTATIDRVELIHTGTHADCNVLVTPTVVDIADLASVMHLVSVNQCPAGPYNRILVGFEKTVTLTSAQTGTVAGTTSLCTFVSYKDVGNSPNVLKCVDRFCSLEINGEVNVLANQQNKLAIDLKLKEFDVTGFGTSSCSVTMKVSPLHGAGKNGLGQSEEVTGLISGLSTTDKTFILTRGNATFTVLYSGITTADQPGLDNLLTRAETDGLRVKVMATTGIDLSTMTISATAVAVKVEGTVSNLNNRTFTLAYGGGKTISVDYNSAIVHGTLADGAGVGVKLYGFDTVNYLASTVDVGDELAIDN